MKKHLINFLLLIVIIFNQKTYADSPLTSTDIYKAYEDLEIIKLASKSQGILTNELFNYLIENNNPLENKIALINQLGWDVNGKNNSDIFLNLIFQKFNYKNKEDFKNKSNKSNLICMAYLKALDNYFDVNEALTYANIATKNNKSFTVNLIFGLIEAQKKFDTDWCGSYMSTNIIRLNKSLIIDMKIEATKIIFDYMDLYKSDCKETQETDNYLNETKNDEEIKSNLKEYVFLNGKKLLSGQKTLINSEDSNFKTSISIVKKENQKMIVFWQESTDRNFNFFNELWVGKVILYLKNGNTITLIDRNLKGHNKLIEVDNTINYQRYSIYYLTPIESMKLKESDLIQVSYKTNSTFENGTTYLKVTCNFETIKEQISMLDSN